MLKRINYFILLFCLLSIGLCANSIIPHANAMGFFSSYDSKADLKEKRKALREQIKQDQNFNTQLKSYQEKKEIEIIKRSQNNSRSYRNSMTTGQPVGGNYGATNTNEALRLNQTEAVYSFESDKRLNALSSWFGDEAKVNRERAESRAEKESERLQYEKYNANKANLYNKNSPRNNGKSEEITDVIDKLLEED